MSSPQVSQKGAESNPFADLLEKHSNEANPLKKAVKSQPEKKDNQDPIIVFDNSDDSGAAPISLGIRQPSFVSLSGTLIPKGSESLDDFKPVIEEVKPIPIESIAEDPDEEEDFDPQVLFVKDLKRKNSKRWKDIGYEPAEDLIPLVRAASQATMTNSISSEAKKFQSSSSFTHIEPIAEESIQEEPIQEEQPPKETKQPEEKPRPETTEATSPRRRSKSFTMREQAEPQQRDDAEALPGRLSEIVSDPPDSMVYRAILGQTEDIDFNSVRGAIKKYISECADRIWIDEAEYLNSLLVQVTKSQKSLPEVAKIEDLKEEEKKIVQDGDNMIDHFEKQLKDCLENNFCEYLEKAKALDEKFQNISATDFKQSGKLLSMKSMIKSMIIRGQIEDARSLKARIESLEAKEIEEFNERVQKRYHSEDLHLKIEYAKKREVLIRQHRFWIERATAECEKKIELNTKRATNRSRRFVWKEE